MKLGKLVVIMRKLLVGVHDLVVRIRVALWDWYACRLHVVVIVDLHWQTILDHARLNGWQGQGFPVLCWLIPFHKLSVKLLTSGK